VLPTINFWRMSGFEIKNSTMAKRRATNGATHPFKSHFSL
jgi:hypothetical protein